MLIKGTWIYLFLVCILSIVFVYSKSILIFLSIELLLIFVFLKVDYKLGIVSCIAFFFFLFYKINNKPYVDLSYVNIQVEVVEAKEKYLIVQNEDILYLVYLKEDMSFIKNDIINIKGQIEVIEKDLDIDVFEFADYLKNKRVFYCINVDKIELIKSSPPINYKIINMLTCRLENESLKMTKMLMFNDKSIDLDSYENLKEISALHLFVVSGFHISFLFKMIEKIMGKRKKTAILSGVLIGFLYLFLLDFSISAFRSVISITLIKLFSKHLSSLDSMSISGLILLLIEPLNIYSYSFIMTYLVTFVINISSYIIKNRQKIIQSLFISFICFLSMIPIQLMLNYEINIISMITNFILSYVVTLIFVLCIIGIPLSLIHGNAFGVIYSFFNKVIDYLSSLNTSLLFGNMPGWLIAIYYLCFLLLIYFLEKRKKIISISMLSSIFLLLILLYNRHIINPYQKVTFLNVYQGDCCIIEDSFSNNVMLIDTGGSTRYDIASKKIIPYLRYYGIRDIDIIVITHDDYDHNGALQSLTNQIKVDKIIDDNNINNVSVGKIHLQNINIFYDEFTDKNDKSIVLYGNIGGLNYLFTGDISKKVENKLIKHYDNLDVDVLKVSHHGSKTSSSEEFIKHISPSYSIISVGYNNFYGHPNQSVIDTLNKYESVIYRTDVNGTIRFVMKNNKLCFIDTAK